MAFIGRRVYAYEEAKCSTHERAGLAARVGAGVSRGEACAWALPWLALHSAQAPPLLPIAALHAKPRPNRGEANAGYAQLRSPKLREMSASPQAYAALQGQSPRTGILHLNTGYAAIGFATTRLH